ncbi:MAG: radical SAM protein [Deltaproteobacteria bacterium]|nr:radical SAM protein [Deltaproteobacteria bacterium]MBW2049644.1 radical SAM protein [Deltaproteobacteria bacterium]MBW2112004.1 radical SAM protein [Deltaproteobacteria bacterium]MBW2354338.1 radical SAM protein [Deltaproteobacteria bacterium]
MDLHALPSMLYADSHGRIYDHPHLRMAGFSGTEAVVIHEEDLIEMPAFSKLFYIPGSPPIGLDPDTGKMEIYGEVEGVTPPCFAVAAFPEPGFVRGHLPAADYRAKPCILPSWAYGAVGFRDEGYWISGFRIEYNHRWDPRNFDDRGLTLAIGRFEHTGPLVEHLVACATQNHCFAAKNLFLKRWEAPMPISQRCNASCLGCLSLQPSGSFEASHERISFTPSKEEIVSLGVTHLREAPEAIISFGQGCEGEPLTEYRLIAQSIREIRSQTQRGTINLNTNGSQPQRVREIAESGLDSIRISINSARAKLYHSYYRPKNYAFEDVVASISLCEELGLYTMVNYLVFPGITDQVEEVEALLGLIRETGLNFLHLKNLCIDPVLYLDKMPAPKGKGIGMRRMVELLREEFPDLQLGYFNQAVTTGG